MSIKKILVLLILFILFFWSGTAGKTHETGSFPMNQLTNPDSIIVDGHHIYISEGTTIHIYNRENLKLEKSFGKTGEGPQEFMLNVMRGMERLLMAIQENNLMVNSLGKISFFNKENGSYVREMKAPSQTSGVHFLGGNYVAQVMMFSDGIQYRTINLYDSKLNKIKEMFKMKHHFQFSKRELKLGEDSTQFLTYEDRLYVAWEKDLIIRVYDHMGKPVRTIHPEYRRVKVTDGYKNKVLTYLKTDPKYKNFMEQMKPKILFPQYFCAIAYVVISDRTLYLFTHREKKKKNECFIMDLQGNLKKKVYLPLWQPDELHPSPFGIKDNKMYRLVENGENWELVVTDIL